MLWGDGERESHRRSRVIDMRGREFAICAVRDLPAHAPLELRRAVARANQHRWLPAIRNLLIVLPICFGVAWMLVALAGWDSKTTRVVVGAIFVIGFGGLTGFQSIRSAAKRAVVACLHEELCPACGYILRGLEGEERVCPECGGVWRVEGEFRKPLRGEETRGGR